MTMTTDDTREMRVDDLLDAVKDLFHESQRGRLVEPRIRNRIRAVMDAALAVPRAESGARTPWPPKALRPDTLGQLYNEAYDDALRRGSPPETAHQAGCAAIHRHGYDHARGVQSCCLPFGTGLCTCTIALCLSVRTRAAKAAALPPRKRDPAPEAIPEPSHETSHPWGIPRGRDA